MMSTETLLPPPATFFQEKHFFASHSPLQLVKQTSSSQERISINGLQKNVHVVVKNAAFMVQISLTNNIFEGHLLDLNNFTFDAMLLYDAEGEKYVDYVKVKPVKCKPTVNDAGNQVSFELRIKVLTSQHENSFFRVKIFILDPTTGHPFHPALAVMSEPVKVISKPEQLKKKPPSTKKRNINEILVETISRIEEQQREHQKMIETLLVCSEAKPILANISKPLSSQEDEGTDFESCFKRFFKTFYSLPVEEKPIKIRKLLRNCSQRETDRVTEFLDLFLTEGLQRCPPAVTSCDPHQHKTSMCDCDSCPYQRELQKIDEFYKNFLLLPESN